jgi:hypothetical protein
MAFIVKVLNLKQTKAFYSENDDKMDLSKSQKVSIGIKMVFKLIHYWRAVKYSLLPFHYLFIYTLYQRKEHNTSFSLYLMWKLC